MKGIENLKPVKTKEEARTRGRAGGIASGKARKEKVLFKEEVEKQLGKSLDSMVLAMINQAQKGNVKAFEVLRDTAGQNPDKVEEIKEEVNRQVYIPAKDIGRAFVDLYRDIEDRKHYEYWIEGGRGSIKSSFWSEIVAEILENNPNMCALLIRKVGNTLKDSVYAQMQWGLDKLGETYPEVTSHWKGTKSPLEIQNINTGQIIYFRGADDPVKIKSIKPPKDKYIGIVVYEEFDQMAGMNEVGTIDRSVIRGGNDFIMLRIYNTPRSSQHFVNKEKKMPKADRLVHRSTYLDVPKDWLGQKFIDEAEYLKSVNEREYRNIYLGEETGSGGNVFENIEVREITDEEINNFDYIYQGCDFGWFP